LKCSLNEIEDNFYGPNPITAILLQWRWHRSSSDSYRACPEVSKGHHSSSAIASAMEDIFAWLLSNHQPRSYPGYASRSAGEGRGEVYLYYITACDQLPDCYHLLV